MEERIVYDDEKDYERRIKTLLTDEEIELLYNSGKSIKELKPRLYNWKCDKRKRLVRC